MELTAYDFTVDIVAGWHVVCFVVGVRYSFIAASHLLWASLLLRRGHLLLAFRGLGRVRCGLLTYV